MTDIWWESKALTFQGTFEFKGFHALVTYFFLWVTLWGVGEELQFSVIFGQDYGVQLT